MSKRTYTRMKQYESIIAAMREDGKSRQEIADELGCEMKQVEWCIARYNKRKKICVTLHDPKPKGRPRKDGQPPRQDIQKELERLRMENKLLRDFLQSTERM